MIPQKDIDLFWRKVVKQPGDGCWEWQGYLNNGYGNFSYGKKLWRAHRFSCLLHGRPIPDDLVTDHLCRNPRCVNPAHLEAVTSAENTRRGVAGAATAKRWASMTHCQRGHPLVGLNSSTGKRLCLECHRDRNRQHVRRKRKSGLTGPAINKCKTDYSLVRSLRAEGRTLQQIAAVAGVSFQSVSKILKRTASTLPTPPETNA